MHKKQAGLTVAGKCGQPNTEGVQVVEEVVLVTYVSLEDNTRLSVINLRNFLSECSR